MACVMVVCIHVSNYYCRGYGLGEVSHISYVISVVWNSASRIAVPIFFMISGSLLLEETIQLKKSFRRVGHTFLALMLWSGIYYIWNYLYRGSLYNLSLVLEEPTKKHLWFLYAIIGIYIVLPFLQSMVKGMSKQLMGCFVIMWFGFLTIAYILSALGADIAYPVPLLGNSCYLGYFILGYIIKKQIKSVPLCTRTCCVGTILSLFFVVVLTCICTWLEGTHVDKLFENRNILIAVSAALVFCAMLKNDSYSNRVKKNLRFLSHHSFTIYLCHAIFLDVVKLEFAPRSISALIGVPMYSAFVFGCSLLFSVIWQTVWSAVQKIFVRKEIA